MNVELELIPAVDVTIYDRATGEVKYTCPWRGSIEELRALVSEEGHEVYEGLVEAHHLIDPSNGLMAPLSDMSPLVRGNTLYNLPPGTTVVVSGIARLSEVGGQITINADYEESVKVVIQNPRYHDKEIIIDVTPHQAEEGFPLPQDFRILRSSAYLPIGDQMDLLIKGISKIPGVNTIPELTELIQGSSDVKSRFQKPKEG